MSILKNEVGRPSNETLKTRRILKGLIFVVTLVICFLGGYMLNGNSKNNSVKEENKQVENEISSKLLFKDEIEVEGFAEFTYNNKKYKLSEKENEDGQDIILNGKTIYKLYIPTGFEKAYLLGDLLVFHCVTSDIRGQWLVFIDLEGNVVKEIKDVIEGDFLFNIHDVENSINIVDNKITVNMTGLTHGPTLVYKDRKDVDGWMPYSETIKNKYNITDDTIIKATYEFNYLGNKEFTEMKLVDKTTYKEFIEDENNW